MRRDDRQAYIHVAGNQPSTDFVAADKDVIVLRIKSGRFDRASRPAREDTPLQRRSAAGDGLVGATASLRAKNVVPERRKIIKHNFKYVPSVSNKFMLDSGRPGRVWPSWPTYV